MSQNAAASHGQLSARAGLVPIVGDAAGLPESAIRVLVDTNGLGGAAIDKLLGFKRRALCFYKPDVVYQYIDIAQESDPGALWLETLPLQISKDIELAFELLRHTDKTKNSRGH